MTDAVAYIGTFNIGHLWTIAVAAFFLYILFPRKEQK